MVTDLRITLSVILRGLFETTRFGMDICSLLDRTVQWRANLSEPYMNGYLGKTLFLVTYGFESSRLALQTRNSGMSKFSSNSFYRVQGQGLEVEAKTNYL